MTGNSQLEILEKYVIKAIVALAGLSLAINSYLVKEKVSEINMNIKELTASMQSVLISQAVMQKQIDQHEARLNNHSERILYVEKTAARVKP